MPATKTVVTTYRGPGHTSGAGKGLNLGFFFFFLFVLLFSCFVLLFSFALVLSGGEGGGEGCDTPVVRANSRDAQLTVLTGLSADGRTSWLASRGDCDDNVLDSTRSAKCDVSAAIGGGPVSAWKRHVSISCAVLLSSPWVRGVSADLPSLEACCSIGRVRVSTRSAHAAVLTGPSTATLAPCDGTGAVRESTLAALVDTCTDGIAGSFMGRFGGRGRVTVDNTWPSNDLCVVSSALPPLVIWRAAELVRTSIRLVQAAVLTGPRDDVVGSGKTFDAFERASLLFDWLVRWQTRIAHEGMSGGGASEGGASSLIHEVGGTGCDFLVGLLVCLGAARANNLPFLARCKARSAIMLARTRFVLINARA